MRSEFVYYGESDGKYDIPKIKKQNIDVNKIEFINYVDTKVGDDNANNKTVHFLLMIGSSIKFITIPMKSLTS